MVVPIGLLLVTLTVREDHTALRSGCSADDTAIAELPAGASLEVRFAIADGSNCFKVTTSVDGKTVTGYVGGRAVTGVDEFEQERAAATEPDGIRNMSPVDRLGKDLAARVSDPPLVRAIQLIRGNQPGEALKILEPLATGSSRNADVLALAGLAAYRSDDLRNALDYWKQSLDLRQDAGLAQMYTKVKREAESDKSAEKLYGNRVLLRYEGEAFPPDTARNVVALLDTEFLRISAQLGCPAEEKIIAVVQSRDAYLKSTGAAEWSGGEYDGRIHIALLEGATLGAQTRRALAHEIVHACLTNIPSGETPWPAWLQEGLAQKLSGDQLPASVLAQLHQMAEAHALPKLEALGQNWMRLSADHAALAYSLALAAADQLFENYQNYGIRNILNYPERLPVITADLDRRLGL